MDTLVAFLNAPALAVGRLSASTAELAGALLGVAMVGCNMRVNPLGWPLAIASSALYLLVFWQARLYGDASLQLVFIVVALWGWWQWLRGHQADGSALAVRYLGAFPTAGSLIGQWLLGRQYVENWPTWVAVNVVGVALFAYKGLWLTAGLYALFALLALAGWRGWVRRAAGAA